MLIIDFPAGWYVLLAFSIVLFAIFSYVRIKQSLSKSAKSFAFSTVRKSFSGCVKFGLIGLGVAIVSEILGVSSGLWNYLPGNWPVILWPVYFLYIEILPHAKDRMSVYDIPENLARDAVEKPDKVVEG